MIYFGSIWKWYCWLDPIWFCVWSGLVLQDILQIVIHIHIHFANNIFEWFGCCRQQRFVSIFICCGIWRCDRTLEVVCTLTRWFFQICYCGYYGLLFRNWRDGWLIMVFCKLNWIIFAFGLKTAVSLLFFLAIIQGFKEKGSQGNKKL